MQTEIFYEEVQFFAGQKVQQVLKLLTGLLVLGSVLSIFIASNQKSEISWSLLTVALFCGVVSFGLSKIKLITQVRTDGIYISFPPLQSRFTVCRWENIDTLFIRTYNPLKEFGGWGIRYGPQGKAYNASGTTGMQIHFKNGSKLLIGTQQPDALRQVLKKINRLDYFY